MLKWTKGISPFAYNTEAKPIEEPTPMTEKQRLALRAEIKAKQVEWALLDADRQREADALQETENEADRLAAEHVEDMEPLQAELRKLEESAIQATIDRRPVDQSKEARRLQLIETLRLANGTLAENLERVRERLRAGSEALMAATLRCGGNTRDSLNGHLLRLGHPDRCDELFSASIAFDDAAARYKRAKRQLAEVTGDATATRRWSAELSAAESALGIARIEVARIRQEIIDE